MIHKANDSVTLYSPFSKKGAGWRLLSFSISGLFLKDPKIP